MEIDELHGYITESAKLEEAEDIAWSSGDVLGIANSQQAQRNLEEPVFSEPQITQQKDSMFYRALKPVLVGASMLTSAILGAGIAKDLTPSLEDIVIANTEHNSEDEIISEHLILEQDFYTSIEESPLTSQSIIGYNEFNITTEDNCINFPDGSDILTKDSDSKAINWTPGVGKNSWSDTDILAPKEVSFCKIGEGQYKFESNNEITLTDSISFGNHDWSERESMRLVEINNNSITFNRQTYDNNNNNVISSIPEIYNIGDQVDLFGGNILTLDNISVDEKSGRPIANLSQNYELNFNEDDFKDMSIGNYEHGDYYEHRDHIDFEFEHTFDSAENIFDLEVDENSRIYESFPILGINQKKVIEDETINPIIIERTYSNNSNYNVELDVKYTNSLGDSESSKVWFNVTDGNATEMKGEISGLRVDISDYQINVRTHRHLNFYFNDNFTLENIMFNHNEEELSQRIANGEKITWTAGSETEYSEVDNKTKLNFKEVITDRLAPEFSGFNVNPEMNGKVIRETDDNYTISLNLFDKTLRDVSVSMINEENEIEIPVSIEIEEAQYWNPGSYYLNVTIPKGLDVGEYILNITADDHANHTTSISKRIINTNFEQPFDITMNQFQVLGEGSSLFYDNNEIEFSGQFDNSWEEMEKVEGLELKIFNESGDVVFSKEYDKFNKSFAIREEVQGLTEGNYVAKILGEEKEYTVNALFREHIGCNAFGNGTDIENPYCGHYGDVLENSPELVIYEINKISGNLSSSDEKELLEIKLAINGQNYTVNNLQLINNPTSEKSINRNIQDEINADNFANLRNLIPLPDGKSMLGFESHFYDHDENGNELYSLSPHFWTTEEIKFNQGEHPLIGDTINNSGEGSEDLGSIYNPGQITNYSYSELIESGIKFMKVLDDGSTIVKQLDTYSVSAIDVDTGTEFYNESERLDDRYILVNPHESLDDIYAFNVRLNGQTNSIERILAESSFTISDVEAWPANNNTDNEPQPENPENNNTDNEPQPETNTSSLEEIAWNPRLDVVPSYINCGDPKEQFEGASLIFYRQNPEENITQYVLQRLDDNAVTNINSEKIEDTEYINERFRNLLSNSNVTDETELSLFGIYQDGTKTPTMNIPIDGSCYSPINLEEEKSEEEIIVDQSFYDKFDAYTFAKYVVPAVVGGIAIGEIQRRRMVNKDKRDNKWEELDATNELEISLEHEYLNDLSEDLFDQD